MKKLILTALLIGIGVSFAQTRITDKQEVYGKWSKSGSPYIIEGEAVVPEGKTLTIKPGTIIMFKTGNDRDYRIDGEINSGFDVGFLRVKGKLTAKGKKAKFISFTGNGEGNWGNVFFENSTGNTLKYCKFESAFYMRGVTENDNATGATSFLNSDGTVENCIYANNGWTAVNCKQSSKPLLKNLTVTMNEYGIECNSNSAPQIVNCIVYGNKTSFFINGGASPTVSHSLVQDTKLSSSAVNLGNNILGEDPQFTDEFKGDFSLKKSSPCKGKAKGGGNIGAVQ